MTDVMIALLLIAIGVFGTCVYYEMYTIPEVRTITTTDNVELTCRINNK